MAANRFATYLHRKTNSRITLVLVYAFLEWSLIFLIFLNSLLSYFILRFADFFGLKRPCLLCSRIDRFFDSSGESPSHLDLLCRNHSLQVSNSKPPKGFVESLYSSSDDLMEKKSSEPDLWGIGYYNISRTLDLIGDDDGDDVQIHNGKLFTERSCSIFVLEEENVGSVLLKDSNDQRRQVEEEEEEEEEEVSSDSNVDDDDEEFSCYMSSFDCNRDISVESKVDLAMEADDSPVESAPVKNLEFYIDDRDCHLIPVEEAREISDVNGDFILDFAAAEEEEDGVSFPEETSTFTSPEELKPETNLVITDSSSDDNEEEVSIGTEIPDYGLIGDIPSSPKHITDTDVEEDGDHSTLEFKTVTIETKKPVFTINKDQDMLLETATMFESIECPEEGGVVLTVDKLKTELEEERKALNALYEELEEERSASAIAANETMAMINRLHEEKSAMQMEALQYQRMMEEQSEFDQEALQLLNELMVNRERENAELEKEIEVYRKRLDEYEAKEKMGMLRRKLSRRDSSVDSYRNNVDAEEEKNNNNNNGELHHKNIEEASNHEYKENEITQNTPVDVVLRLDECLDDYEGERLSILGRLKFLEEKLTSLNDEEDEEEDEEEEAKTFENNGNGHFHGNGKHRVIKSKRLLPLFDAVDGEMEESNGNNHDENGFDESEKEGEIVTVEEEVDELYERLEALEADREFLRHCVGSLRKGDKGVHLLHEILQHLRDLKNIDLIRIGENQDITF
ncbi:unnamed protein product [Cochlearia groenlandica]